MGSRHNQLRARCVRSSWALLLGLVLSCASKQSQRDSAGDCCKGRGACTASASLDARYESLWAHESCADDFVCVPDELHVIEATPATCHAATSGAEGRCLPECLGIAAERSGWLEQDDCKEHERCLPCVDPITGDETGACALAKDPGPQEESKAFALCCDDTSRCVPEDSLSETERTGLGRDSCDDGQLCVQPDALNAGESYVPDRCITALQGEGRCLPACLPLLDAQRPRLAQNNCREGLVCAPCADPTTGAHTGACTLGADMGPRSTFSITFPSCCGELGHCVPGSFVPEGQRDNLSQAGCTSASALCVPDAFAASNFKPKPCTAAAFGAEGRCLPACLGALDSQRDRLGQDDCPDQHLCAPCFDPISGASTGSCAIGEDPGPSEPPKTFAGCCGGAGHCIPSTLVPDEQRGQLSAESCADSDALCVPDKFTSSDFVPASCVAQALGAEGRCLPACLEGIRAQADRLTQDGCESGELCAPCFDPFTGAATGSCALGRDPGPTASAPTFAGCCGDAGHCVPEALVPEVNRSSLAALTCTDAGALCVPDAFTQADFRPSSCTVSAFGAEGRCLPDCLPQLAAQSGLVRDGCPEHALCAPCFDPFTGAATGSCGLGTDPGPTAPAVILPACCDGVGHCVPERLVPQTQRASLAALSCSEPEAVCVPDAFTSAAFVPKSCSTEDYAAEGRCLPACLPQLASQLTRLSQADCATHEVCAPCYDPTTGAATGSCAIGRDPGPTQPATQFAECCTGAGRCVPRSLVPDDQETQLGADVCQEADRLCVPTEISSSPSYLPAKCTVAAVGAEGRCLPSCLPAVAARSSVLQPDGCPTGDLCAPCFDPLTGAATPVCSFPGDTGPSTPAVRLASCCGERGLCTPRTWVPPAQTSALGKDTCDVTQDTLCVAPAQIARDPGYVPPTCNDPRTQGEGRCLPTCLPAVADRAGALVQASCGESDRCVPCFDPLSGSATGACGLGADKGAVGSPVVFDRCCGEGADSPGVCVPGSFLPEGTPALGAQSCTRDGVSCVPSAIATNQPLPGCSALGAKGVCLQSCFVQALLQLLTPQDSCADGTLCVSCDVLGTSVAGCAP